MPRPATPIGQLTDREQDVARLLARGKTNPEIAEELGITFAIAKWYVSQVLARLDASSREEAAEIWRREHALPARLRRGIAAIGAGSVAKQVSLAAGAVGATAVAAIVLFAVLGDDDDATPTIDATPSALAISTATTVVASPCDESNLLNGFLVIGEGESVPECIAGRIPSLEIVEQNPVSDPVRVDFFFDVPSGPWRGAQLAATDVPDGTWLFGDVFYRGESETLAFARYGHLLPGLPGAVVRGSNARPVDFLPGPGIVVDRTGSVAAYWMQGVWVAGFELFNDGGSNLTPELAAGLVGYFDDASGTAFWWDPVLREFETRPQWLYPDDVDTGLVHINDIIRTFTPGNQSLQEFADTVLAACIESPAPAIRQPPSCPAGEPEGTLVPALLSGGCPGHWFPVDPANIDILESGGIQRSWLYAIAEVDDPEAVGLRHVAAFTTGERVLSLGLTDSGVAGIWGGGSCATPELAEWARTVDGWLLPPLYPLPD